jgi:hypothetical protein
MDTHLSGYSSPAPYSFPVFSDVSHIDAVAPFQQNAHSSIPPNYPSFVGDYVENTPMSRLAISTGRVQNTTEGHTSRSMSSSEPNPSRMEMPSQVTNPQHANSEILPFGRTFPYPDHDDSYFLRQPGLLTTRQFLATTIPVNLLDLQRKEVSRLLRITFTQFRSFFKTSEQKPKIWKSCLAFDLSILIPNVPKLLSRR